MVLIRTVILRIPDPKSSKAVSSKRALFEIMVPPVLGPLIPAPRPSV